MEFRKAFYVDPFISFPKSWWILHFLFANQLAVYFVGGSGWEQLVRILVPFTVSFIACMVMNEGQKKAKNRHEDPWTIAWICMAGVLVSAL